MTYLTPLFVDNGIAAFKTIYRRHPGRVYTRFYTSSVFGFRNLFDIYDLVRQTP